MPSFLIIFFYYYFFWSNSFDCGSPTCPAIRRGNYNVYMSHPGPQIQEKSVSWFRSQVGGCSGAGCMGRQPERPPVPACLSTTSASELGPLELVRLQSEGRRRATAQTPVPGQLVLLPMCRQPPVLDVNPDSGRRW